MDVYLCACVRVSAVQSPRFPSGTNPAECFCMCACVRLRGEYLLFLRHPFPERAGPSPSCSSSCQTVRKLSSSLAPRRSFRRPIYFFSDFTLYALLTRHYLFSYFPDAFLRVTEQYPRAKKTRFHVEGENGEMDAPYHHVHAHVPLLTNHLSIHACVHKGTHTHTR